MTQTTLEGKRITLEAYLNTKPFPDVYFDTINCCAMVDSGTPMFIVAPPSGAKTTIIKTLEKLYRDRRFVYTLERISPMRFLKLQYQMQDKDNLLLSEDFSTLGDEEGAVFKMATLIAKLSYDKKYIDPFFTTKDAPEGLKLIVKSLSFVCGMQPMWIQIYGAKEVFETLIMEKLLRYYRLPIMPIKDIAPMQTVIEIVSAKITQDLEDHAIVELDADMLEKETKFFATALKVQCGARGIEYAKLIVLAIALYIPKEVLHAWLVQTAMRFKFEERFLLRGYEPLKIGIKHEALYREYTVLFFAMQYNLCTYDMLKDFCKIRGKTKSATSRYMRLLIRYGLECGYINVLKKTRLYIIPSPDYQNYTLHDFNASILREDKHSRGRRKK